MKDRLTERDYYLPFSVYPDIGPIRMDLILKYFGSAKNAWEAPDYKFIELGLSKNITANFSRFRKSFLIPSFKTELYGKNIGFFTLADGDYPGMLKNINDPPIVLYYKGNKEILGENKFFIGIVGTRMMSVYGRNCVRKIVPDLVRQRCVIVSGMAAGIDTAAHLAAIETGGKTIAVLGCGIDVVYPAENRGLYREITEKHGLAVSEYPPGFGPSKTTFPLRNRIISGLSQAVLVVEGKMTSGAMITARYALDQGREVMAVPGPINSPLSDGPSYLIKNGAMVVSNPGDVLSLLTSGVK